MATWVGSPIPTPAQEARGSSPVGRQQHYGAVELGDASDQVNLNDVVEVEVEADEAKADSEIPAPPQRSRLAQVCRLNEHRPGCLYNLVILASGAPSG